MKHAIKNGDFTGIPVIVLSRFCCDIALLILEEENAKGRLKEYEIWDCIQTKLAWVNGEVSDIEMFLTLRAFIQVQYKYIEKESDRSFVGVRRAACHRIGMLLHACDYREELDLEDGRPFYTMQTEMFCQKAIRILINHKIAPGISLGKEEYKQHVSMHSPDVIAFMASKLAGHMLEYFWKPFTEAVGYVVQQQPHVKYFRDRAEEILFDI